MRIQTDLRTGECKVICPRCKRAYGEEIMEWTDRHNITRRQFFLCASCRQDFQGDWLRLKRTPKARRGALYRRLFARRGA
jgi:transposase-like protein